MQRQYKFRKIKDLRLVHRMHTVKCSINLTVNSVNKLDEKHDHLRVGAQTSICLHIICKHSTLLLQTSLFPKEILKGGGVKAGTEEIIRTLESGEVA